jgi:hypothetical protein
MEKQGRLRPQRGKANQIQKGKPLSETWGPPIATGVIAPIASLVLAHCNSESAEKRLYLELRIKHADAATKYFEAYITSWGRMIIKCKYLDEQRSKEPTGATPPSSIEKIVKDPVDDRRQKEIEEIATKQRNPAKDALWAEFDALNLYFSAGVTAKVEKFKMLDAKYRAAPCKDLPSNSSEWDKLKDDIVGQLHLELRPGANTNEYAER